MKTKYLIVAALFPFLNLCADTYEWTGNAGGAWNAPGNWNVGGAAATTAPAADDTLSIAAATDAKPFTVNTEVIIPNPIVLGSGQQVFKMNANGVRATLTGVISGSGGITVKYYNDKTYFRLSGANTFTGGVTRDGAGQVEVTHSQALGTGPFVGKLPASGTTTAVALSVRGDNLTIANDLTFQTEANYGYNGCASFQSTTHLTGTVTFNGDTRIAGGTAVYFDGPTVIKGRLTTNENTDYYFNTAITGNGYLHTDQSKGKWHLRATGNVINRAYIASGSTTPNRLYLEADQAVPETFYVQYDASNADATIDLCGHATTMERLYNGAPRRVVTSSSPATLTLAAKNNATWGGCYTGLLSVDYAATGAFTLTSTGNVQSAHTMSGSLTVSSGTFKLSHNASFSSLLGLAVKDAATFDLDATAGDVAALTLNTESGAIFKLGAGRKVTVWYAEVAGQTLAVGTYTKANLGAITGDGSLVVTKGGAADSLWVWTGLSGGDWTAPGNWLVNGAVPVTAPPSNAKLYIAAAGEATPFVVQTAVTIPNDIILMGGQQIISNATDKGTVSLTGTISGTGGIMAKFKNAGYLSLSGNNTFAGGVTRVHPGQLKIMSVTGAGTGTIDLGNGSAQGSGISNNQGLYVKGGLTVANDLKVGAESYVSWNGWWAGEAGKTVHLAGDVWFSGQTRYGVASTIHYDGTVYLKERQVAKSYGGGRPILYYAKAIQPNAGTTGKIYPDNGSCEIHFQASSNQLSAVQAGNMTDFRLSLEAPDALAGVPISWESATDAANAGTRIDLCGNDQHVLRLQDAKTANPPNHVVTSTANAKLTVNQDQANNIFTGRFLGGVSLELDASNSASVYHLTNALHETTGDFIATKGTLSLEGGASAPNLRTIEVGAAGRFVVTATAGTVGARSIKVVTGGKIVLPADRTLTVMYVKVGDTCTSAPTTFTSENADWLESGTVVVTGLRVGYLTWTGDAGGAWNAAGNWLNDQGEAQVPVTSGDTPSRLFLTGAGQGSPLVFTQAVELNNEILLDEGQQTLQCDAAVSIRGVVTGEGGILKTGSAQLSLYGDQTFTGGVETKDGILAGYSVGAFGPGLVKVGAIYTGTAALKLQRGLTYTNDFEIESLVTSDGKNTIPTIDALNASGRLTLSGNVSFVRNGDGANHFRFNFPITFAGTVTMSGISYCTPYSGHSVVTKTSGLIFERPIVCTAGYLYFFTDQNASDITFRGAGNQIKWLELWGNTQKYSLDCVNALTADSCIQMGDYGSAAGASVDLCGYDQTVDSVFDVKPNRPAHAIVSPNGPATITMKASADRLYAGDFKDAVSIVWDPLADYVYTITNVALTTTGSITVKRGAVRLVDATALSLSAIEIKSGAAFRTRGSTTLNPRLETLTIEEGSTLDLDGQLGVFDAVIYKGQPLPSGQIYTHATMPELAEGTSLCAGGVAATWTGGGATTSMSLADNWADGLPDLEQGTVTATFATGGTQATLASDVFLRGMVLNAVNGFTFAGAQGTETLNLGADGLAVATESGARTDTFNVPVAVTAAQTWRVSGAGANALVFNAGLQVPVGRTVRREQTAGSELKLNGATTVDGRLEITNGVTRVTGVVGGSGTVAWWRGNDVSTDCNLEFKGMTSACDWELAPQNAKNAYGDGTVTFAANTTNRFDGFVTGVVNQHFRPIASANSSVVFAGGYDFKTVFVARGSAGSEFVFTGTPGKFASITDDRPDYTPHLRFCSAGHNFNGSAITLCGASTLDLECANAITNLGAFTLFGDCRINLNGYDLTCSRLTHESSYIKESPVGPVVVSTPAAILTVKETGTVSNCVAFAEGAGLRKASNGTVKMHGTSTSTGVVEVVAGTLEFASNGSWRNASEVRIAAGATNVLNSRRTYGPATRLTLASGGTLNLNFNSRLRLGGFVANDVSQPDGTYCAPGNTSAIQGGATPIQGITGNGTILVGECGMLLIVK